MEAETEMKVVQVNLKCPDCEINMKLHERADHAWFAGPNKWLYKCSRCGTTSVSEKQYPYKKYVPK